MTGRMRRQEGKGRGEPDFEHKRHKQWLTSSQHLFLRVPLIRQLVSDRAVALQQVAQRRARAAPLVQRPVGAEDHDANFAAAQYA